MSRNIQQPLVPVDSPNIHMTSKTLKTLLHRFKEADVLLYVLVLIVLMSSGILLLLKILTKHPVSHQYRVRSPGLRWFLGTLILTGMLFVLQLFLWRMYHIFMENHLNTFLTYGQQWSSWRGMKQKLGWMLGISALVSFIFIGYLIYRGRHTHSKRLPKHQPVLRYVPSRFIQKHLDLMWKDLGSNTVSDPCADNNDN